MTLGGGRYIRRLTVSLVLVAVVMVVQAVAGFLTRSLALLSDAGHMLTDALGLGMALAAIVAARHMGENEHRTFGLYRLEILAAAANALLLFIVAVYVIIEGIRRLFEPLEIVSGAMLVVALIGLAVNLIAWRLLRHGAEENLNLEGAYLEVLADLIGSIAVIAAALIVEFTGWLRIDPILAIVIGVYILPRAWRLGGKALRVLVQAAPRHVDVKAIDADLRSLPGVVEVHDLHVWSLTSQMEVASVHLVVQDGTDSHEVLRDARERLRSDHLISHATLQVEPESQDDCQQLTW